MLVEILILICLFLTFYLDLQTERLGTLKREYMEEQMTLMNEFDTERAMLIEQHMQEMNDLQVMNFCLLCVELYIFLSVIF